MRAHVPLAAPVDHGQSQSQNHSPERVLVSPPPVTSLGEPAWEAFYALVYVASAILVESAPLAADERAAASLALAAMIPWYLVLGRPVMRLDEERWQLVVTTWRGPAYLAGMIALFAVVQHATPNAWFLAFALSPQCFQMTIPVRRAMAFVVVLNVVAGLLVVLGSRTAQSIPTAAGTTLFAIAFSVVYSRWTTRVIEQSRERAALIAQLESAQAELAAAYHEAGVHAERQRLAAEIHDTLAQGFLSIVTLLQAAQSVRASTAAGLPGPDVSAPAEPAPAVPDAPAHGPGTGSRELALECPGPGDPGPGAPDLVGGYLELAVATARENLAEARALVTALAPAGLEDAGLIGAVARATEATGKAAGIEATCAAEGDRYPLPTATEVVLLRVCQEALANVRKHAAASRVDVRLRYAPRAVELAVADNGRGFGTAANAAAGASGASGAAAKAAGTADGAERAGDAGGTGPRTLPEAAAAGFGLRSMSERLRQVGGTLTVASAPGAGTTIRAEIPV